VNDYLIYGDVDTRDYEGVYVYVSNIDEVPQRVGEYINIPGRHGAFYRDKMYYEDVNQSYSVVAIDSSVGRDLINAITSQTGHHRLQDSFTPEESYEAVVEEWEDIKVTTERDKFTCVVTFRRKPQRWLVEGESLQTVNIGAVNPSLVNPTHFDSSPLIVAKMKSGDSRIETIMFDGRKAVDIRGNAKGKYKLLKARANPIIIHEGQSDNKLVCTLMNTSAMAILDPITCASVTCYLGGDTSGNTGVIQDDGLTFQYGRPQSFTVGHLIVNPSTGETSEDARLVVTYNGVDEITIEGRSVNIDYKKFAIKYAAFYGNSSKNPIDGKQIYIDCELGEAYITDSDILTKGGSVEHQSYRSAEEDHFIEIPIDTSKIQVGEEFTCDRININFDQAAEFSNLTFEKGQASELNWNDGNGKKASVSYDGVTDKITIAPMHYMDNNDFYYPLSTITWADFVGKVSRFLEPSDNLISVNDCVSFGASLPVLKPGETIITNSYDNLDGLKIKPRWWKV